MKKLVRDRIPEIIISRGEKPIFYQAAVEEYAVALKEKLAEECMELQEAIGHDDIIAEAADVLEVVEAILKLNKITLATVEEFKQRKKDDRGGFAKKYILEM